MQAPSATAIHWHLAYCIHIWSSHSEHILDFEKGQSWAASMRNGQVSIDSSGPFRYNRNLWVAWRRCVWIGSLVSHQPFTYKPQMVGCALPGCRSLWFYSIISETSHQDAKPGCGLIANTDGETPYCSHCSLLSATTLLQQGWKDSRYIKAPAWWVGSCFWQAADMPLGSSSDTHCRKLTLGKVQHPRRLTLTRGYALSSQGPSIQFSSRFLLWF